MILKTTDVWHVQWSVNTPVKSALHRILLAGIFSLVFIKCALGQPQSEADIPSEITVRGLVLSVADHKPIPGASVQLFLSHRAATTDSQGRFEFTGVPLGQNEQISAKDDGFLCALHHYGQLPNCIQSIDQAMWDQVSRSKDQSEAQKVLKAAKVDVTLTLLAAARVNGQLVDQMGKPIRDMKVFLSYRTIADGQYVWNGRGGSAKSDANGDFQMKDVEPGTYLLYTQTTVSV